MLLKTFRPHQWVKNLLVLVPILTSHRFSEIGLWREGLIAFVVFCVSSSAVYVINDLADLEADREHPTKRTRPFASGKLNTGWALPVCTCLFAIALTVAWFQGASFFIHAVAYVCLAVLYTTYLKKHVLLDVFALAALYTLRLLAGGSITGIPISVWLAAFAAFIFLSLALCKRYVELRDYVPIQNTTLPRRGYRNSDLQFVLVQGLIFMGCATLVLAVYLSSSAVTLLYPSPAWLWAAVAIVSFWGSRLWLLALRGQVHDDPVLFALCDAVSWICLCLLFGSFFAAMMTA